MSSFYSTLVQIHKRLRKACRRETYKVNHNLNVVLKRKRKAIRKPASKNTKKKRWWQLKAARLTGVVAKVNWKYSAHKTLMVLLK